jgi:hypothetical protein
MIYNGNSQVILGVSESVYQSFGIPASLIYGNTNASEIKIVDIVPAIANPKNLEELKDGMTVMIDTTEI